MDSKHRLELYKKLNSWVNKLGGDEAFADNFSQVPRTVRELVYATPKLMQRFGLTNTENEKQCGEW